MLIMDSTPPPTWGRITGTVTGTERDGTTVPLSGATVRFIGSADTYTRSTDTGGMYGIWLDQSESPVTMIVALDNWQPQVATVDVTERKTTTAHFTLTPLSAQDPGG
jgi:hypothetical protein